MIKQAFVSGPLGKAVYIDEEQDQDRYFMLSLGELSPAEARRRDVDRFLGSKAEFRELTSQELNIDAIRQALKSDERRHTALFLTLACLDGSLSQATRSEIAEAAEELLADETTKRFVKNRLLGRPTPVEAIEGLEALEDPSHPTPQGPHLRSLYSEAYRAQPAIQRLASVWNRVVRGHYDSDQIPRIQRLLVDSGFLAELACSLMSGEIGQVQGTFSAWDPKLKESIPGISELLDDLQQALMREQFEIEPARKQKIYQWIWGNRASLIVALLTISALTAIWKYHLLKLPSFSVFKPIEVDLAHPGSPKGLSTNEQGILIRRLVATVLVYFMQFGFIAFEAGAVRQRYRKHSAVKNLIVSAVAFMAYFSLGWQIQWHLNYQAISNLLDVAFNAGFASTVALIIANTITERGTILVNALCSIIAGGVAYPLLAGLAFADGPFAKNFGFIDTAGGLVVHVLGGTLGVAAALWIGPRAKRRASDLLGKVRVEEINDQIPLTVIGAFFLWFGWLGFNSGNAKDWDSFLAAFFNTGVGAGTGGLVGLIVAAINRLLLTGNYKRLKGSQIGVEISHLERIALGMMGGLVAVTANASIVGPDQAFLEALLGSVAAIVGSAVMAVFMERLDDPLGAISTHGLAGMVGVLCTALFHKSHLLSQLRGCGIAVALGLTLGSIPCFVLKMIELGRRQSESWWYGTLLRMTAHQEKTGRSGTEFWSPAEDIEKAIAYLRERSGIPNSIKGVDRRWINAVRVLALSETANVQSDLVPALERVLSTRKDGSPEEQTAIAAISTRADFTRWLPECVDRALAHRGKLADSQTARKWNELDGLYAKTLIMTISDLSESFAAEYRVLRIKPTYEGNLQVMIDSFGKACNLLREIGEERPSRFREILLMLPGSKSINTVSLDAWREFKDLVRLPWYDEIIEKFRNSTALPIHS